MPSERQQRRQKLLAHLREGVGGGGALSSEAQHSSSTML